MPIQNAIPELWSARIIDGFARTNVWGSLTTDASDEVIDGDKLNMTKITSDVIVKDYTGANIDAPQVMDDAKETLDLDQKKYFNIEVDDIDRVQARPALLSHFTLQAAREVAKTYDEFVQTTFANGIPANRTIDAGGLPGDLKDITDAQLQTFITAINDAITTLTAADFPLDQIFFVINNEAGFAVREYLIRQGVGTGKIGDDVMLNGGLSNLFGVRTRIDRNLPIADANGEAYGYFGTPDAMITATQVRSVEAYRPEQRFTDAVRGLFVYGGEVVLGGHRAKLVRSA